MSPSVAAFVLVAALQADPAGPVGPLLSLSANGPASYFHSTDAAYCPVNDRYVSVLIETNDGNQQYLRSVTTDAITGEVSAKIDLNVNEDWIDSPAISWNPAVGLFLVVYSRYEAITWDGPFIYGILLNPDGTPQGGGAGFPISGAPGSVNWGDIPRVACDGSDWMTVWTIGNGSIDETKGRVVDGTSTNATPAFGGATFLVYGSPNAAGRPAIAFGAGADYLVAWVTTSSNAYLYGRTVSPTGAVLGAVTQYDNTFGSGYGIGSMTLTANTAESEFVVAWSRYPYVAAPGAAYARRITPAGALVGAAVQVDVGGKGIADGVRIAWNADTNRYVAAWFEDATPYDASYIYDLRAALLAGATLAPMVQGIVLTNYGSIGPALGMTIASRPSDSQVLIQWKKEPWMGGANPVQAQRFLIGPEDGTPMAPVLLAQHRLDDGGALNPGGTTSMPGVLLKAWADQTQGVQMKLQAEVRPVNTAFTGVATATGPLSPAHAVLGAAMTPLALDAQFHWQVRAVDYHGVATAWVPYGAQPDLVSEIDLRTRSAQSVPALGAPTQTELSTGKLIAVGHVATEGKIQFLAAVTDGDGDACSLEIEVQPAGTGFSGTPNVLGLPGPPGTLVAIATLSRGQYHWRARSRDALLDVSAWTDFGGNDEYATDLELLAIGSKGGSRKCSGAAAPGAALLALVALPFLLRRRNS